MGAVVRELEQGESNAGAEILPNGDLRALGLAVAQRTVEFYKDGERQTVEARYLLVNFGRNVLAKYIGQLYQPDATDEGSVFKINMLLQRLPKLKATRYASDQPWRGTFHSDEGYEQINASYDRACSGRLPNKAPSEAYCHAFTYHSTLAQ